MTHDTTTTPRPTLPATIPERLLTSHELTVLGHGSRSTIYRLVRDGYFPAPIRIGPRRIRWRASDIEAFLARAAQDRGAKS